MRPVRLSAATVAAIPRWSLLLLGLFYLLPGLIGRDVWKQDDAIVFFTSLSMVHGSWLDWLQMQITGMAFYDEGPLSFWLTALIIKIFSPLFGDLFSARIAIASFFCLAVWGIWQATYNLALRPEAQPARLPFGGQPAPNHFARTIADSAALLYIASLGLLVRGHELSAELLQNTGFAALLYLSVLYEKQRTLKIAVMLGLCAGLMALTRGWVIPLASLALIFLHTLWRHHWRALLQIIVISISASLPVLIWYALLFFYSPSGTSAYLEWQNWNLNQYTLPSLFSLVYVVKNSIWFIWPAWPFALWAIWTWRQQIKNHALHITLPLSFCVLCLLLNLLSAQQDIERLLITLVPFSILAAFGLPTVKRSVINAVDWFAVMFFTCLSIFISLGWLAMQTGWPKALAANAFKLAHGFIPPPQPLAIFFALSALAFWIYLVRWRIQRQPSVLWRAVILSAAGITLCWTLLMSLWLPWIDYRKSYTPLAQEILHNIPAKSCINSNAGDAQRALFAYYGKLQLTPENKISCAYYLLQDSQQKPIDIAQINSQKKWIQIWQGHRAADRNERFRLYHKEQSK